MRVLYMDKNLRADRSTFLLRINGPLRFSSDFISRVYVALEYDDDDDVL